MGPVYVEELDSGFTTEGIKRMRENKAPFVDRIPAETWREISTRDIGLKIMRNFVHWSKEWEGSSQAMEDSYTVSCLQRQGERK